MTGRVWEAASRTLRTSAPYERLRRELGDVVRLPVPAAAWVVGLLAEDLGRPVLAVVPREADALAWLEAASLFGAAPGSEAVFFPSPSLTPYQEAAASLHVRAQEVVALDRVLSGRAGTVLTTPRALFRRLPSREAFLAAVVEVRPGEDRPLDELAEHLLRWGYRRTDLVSEVGDFAVRGGILDAFPPGGGAPEDGGGPVRIELFGDTVDTLRRFDPVTQRSEERIDSLRLLPLLLYPGGEAEARRLASLLSDMLWEGRRPRGGAPSPPPTTELRSAVPGEERVGVRRGDPMDPEVGRLLDRLREHGEAPGWENYLPLLAAETALLADFLPGALTVAVDPPALVSEAEHYAERLAADFGSRLEAGRLAVPPEALEHPPEAVAEILDGAQVRLRDLLISAGGVPGAGVGAGAATDFHATTTDVFHGQLPRFPPEVAAARARGERPVVVVEPDRREALAELLDGRGVPVGAAGVELVAAEAGPAGLLERGFRLPAAAVAVYGEYQLLPRGTPRQRPARRPRYGPFVSGLRDLRVGDFVVHADHGIGQFVGLRSVESDGAGGSGPGKGALPATLAAAAPAGDGAVEVMEISYASGQRLLLPLSRLDQVQKFSGIEGVAPRLDRLGGTSWNKTKARVRKSLRDMADELVKLYAERQLASAPAMPADSDLMRQFEAAFPHDETPDQLEAIAAIKADLEETQPMDRLLCGDVGYGKTEVAMRAAFKAVDGGYQVAVLAPTTILADQHLDTFRDRFQDFPVRVEMISRFRTPAEVRDVKRRLAAGEIDVLVGTHRLLSRDIEIPKLGLLIVDEEQRFGVAQKERLKQLKKSVHVLAMSATPVPRTLQLSLAGVRDLSVIETPPKDRMAVETAVVRYSPEVIREAIEYEIERGGQVYYVHNRVESIEEIQVFLQELVPGVRATVGHGQMDEAELSRRMHAFTRGEYDLLLATTIIENGIDIPNVNTMIIHRADRFGLAQLYQLRGRVGRSNQLAYCYLLTPGDRVESEDARKRLAAIQEFTDLGAGFRIAARDLEIRGAGNLLGAEQSGHIAAVGIETYLKMLEDAVRELKGEAVAEEGPSVAIDLPVPMAIPRDYVADENLRMELYQKLASDESDPRELLAELADRFGPPPAAIHTLLEVAALKRDAEGLRVQSISGRGKSLTIRLRQDSRIDVERLIELVSGEPGASFSPTGVLTLRAGDGHDMLAAARRTLGALAA
ncbi:MAG TPA: transcription-repair coupling factor [Thermoanaerobaculia bacterium]|nr:transcription-repair coupling factor [Thermoanaerobaculia bacterium]